MKSQNDDKEVGIDEPKSTPAQILATDGPRRVTAPAPPNESAVKEARRILSHE